MINDTIKEMKIIIYTVKIVFFLIYKFLYENYFIKSQDRLEEL